MKDGSKSKGSGRGTRRNQKAGMPAPTKVETAATMNPEEDGKAPDDQATQDNVTLTPEDAPRPSDHVEGVVPDQSATTDEPDTGDRPNLPKSTIASGNTIHEDTRVGDEQAKGMAGSVDDHNASILLGDIKEEMRKLGMLEEDQSLRPQIIKLLQRGAGTDYLRKALEREQTQTKTQVLADSQNGILIDKELAPYLIGALACYSQSIGTERLRGQFKQFGRGAFFVEGHRYETMYDVETDTLVVRSVREPQLLNDAKIRIQDLDEEIGQAMVRRDAAGRAIAKHDEEWATYEANQRNSGKTPSDEVREIAKTQRDKLTDERTKHLATINRGQEEVHRLRNACMNEYAREIVIPVGKITGVLLQCQGT